MQARLILAPPGQRQRQLHTVRGRPLQPRVQQHDLRRVPARRLLRVLESGLGAHGVDPVPRWKYRQHHRAGQLVAVSGVPSWTLLPRGATWRRDGARAVSRGPVRQRDEPRVVAMLRPLRTWPLLPGRKHQCHSRALRSRPLQSRIWRRQRESVPAVLKRCVRRQPLPSGDVHHRKRRLHLPCLLQHHVWARHVPCGQLHGHDGRLHLRDMLQRRLLQRRVPCGCVPRHAKRLHVRAVLQHRLRRGRVSHGVLLGHLRRLPV